MAVIVIADLKMDGGKRGEFLQMVGEMLDVTRAAEGCGGVEVVIDMDDPGRVVLLERWDDRAQHEQYLAARAEDGSLAAVGDVLTAPPTFTYTELTDI